MALNALTPVWLQKPIRIGGYDLPSQKMPLVSSDSAVTSSLSPTNLSAFSYSRALDRRYSRVAVWAILQR